MRHAPRYDGGNSTKDQMSLQIENTKQHPSPVTTPATPLRRVRVGAQSPIETTMNTHIAMWSGPRNISTAMMRAWGHRPDTVVWDEPLYAHYLLATGRTNHPGYAETIANHETDWRKVVAKATGPPPGGKRIYYQKHMAHHVLPEMSIEWIGHLTNCFLIRQPREMLLSMNEFLPSLAVGETGLPQQVEMFERIAERDGVAPPVVDSRDVLADPRGMLSALCSKLSIPFYDEMLAWPPGPRESDGAWAPFWYAKVYNTTSFGTYRANDAPLPDRLARVLDECQALYERLWQHRLQVEPQSAATSARGTE